jgi:AmiR/NasT family two-component response regulator
MTELRDQESVEELDALRRQVAQLQEALESRVQIEQAKGVLAERFALDPESAFVLLRAAARGRRIKIHHLAADVVASRVTPEPIAWALRRNGGRPR